MARFYPEVQPFKTEFLRVSDIHELNVEQSGREDGEPVLFLHGGPGGGINSKIRTLFDPEHYRLIAFDQRGAGKSTPSAELEENDTWNLIQDIETIREHLGIEKWKVHGGSWGTTLALSYAINHPDRVTDLVLRAIFLCRKEDVRWLYQEGANFLYPDCWESYRDAITEEKRSDFVSAYYAELTAAEEERRLKAAKAWTQWEAATSSLYINEDAVEEMGEASFALKFARIECHYFSNGGFFPTDNYIIENIDKIRHIPAFIVHGRYDVVCPLKQAYDLKQAWPEAELVVSPTSGHACFEKENAEAQLEALNRMKRPL